MGYSLPETHFGTMATAACPCAEILGDSAGEVKRFCGGTFSRGGEWREGLDVSCETTLSEVSRQLCDIASVTTYVFYLLLQCFISQACFVGSFS